VVEPDAHVRYVEASRVRCVASYAGVRQVEAARVRWVCSYEEGVRLEQCELRPDFVGERDDAYSIVERSSSESPMTLEPACTEVPYEMPPAFT
jgi:hypothetical protein